MADSLERLPCRWIVGQTTQAIVFDPRGSASAKAFERFAGFQMRDVFISGSFVGDVYMESYIYIRVA